MLFRLTKVMGDLPPSWSQGFEMMQRINGRSHPVTASKENQLQQLRKAVPQACPQALDLIWSCLVWNPEARPMAKDCLQHPFFSINDAPR
jgi:protein kinase